MNGPLEILGQECSIRGVLSHFTWILMKRMFSEACKC